MVIKMSTNPFIMALGMYVIITVFIYISIKINHKKINKNSNIVTSKKNKTVTPKSQSTSKTINDVYHVGGITSEQFILELLSTYSLDYAGYSYEELYNKKTQVDYDAYDLFDVLWVLFGTFDEILECDYVEDGYGTMNYKEVQVRYNAKKDHMKIDMADLTIEGTIEEMTAFRHNPLKNYEMLDPISASNHIEDYIGEINIK